LHNRKPDKKNKKVKHILLKIILVLSFFCSIIQISAQQRTFSKVIYNDTENIQCSASARNSNGDYVIVGKKYGNGGIVINVDKQCTKKWGYEYKLNQETYFSSIDGFKDVIFTNNEDIIVVGNFYNYDTGKSVGVCIKLNSVGDTIWIRNIVNEDFYVSIKSVVQTNDLGFTIAGELISYELDKKYIFISKLNENGELKWFKLFKQEENQLDITEIQELTDNSIILGGNRFSSGGSNAYLLKITSNGELLWSKVYKNDKDNPFTKLNDLLIDNDKYIVSLDSKTGLVILDLNLDGEIIQNNFYTSHNKFRIQNPHITILHDKSLAILFSIYFSHGSGILKVDSLGDPQFSRELFLYSIEAFETENKELVIFGNGPIQGEKSKLPKDEIGIIQLDSLATEQNCVFASQVSKTTGEIFNEDIVFTSNTIEIENNVQIEILDFNFSTSDRCVGFVGNVDKNILNEELEIFPNPNNGYFEIQSDKMMQEIAIYNLLGNKVFESGKVIRNSFTFSSEILPGVYLATIFFTDRNQEVIKIIITD